MPCALIPTNPEMIWGHHQLAQTDMLFTGPMCEDTTRALGRVPPRAESRKQSLADAWSHLHSSSKDDPGDRQKSSEIIR